MPFSTLDRRDSGRGLIRSTWMTRHSGRFLVDSRWKITADGPLGRRCDLGRGSCEAESTRSIRVLSPLPSPFIFLPSSAAPVMSTSADVLSGPALLWAPEIYTMLCINTLRLPLDHAFKTIHPCFPFSSPCGRVLSISILSVLV